MNVDNELRSLQRVADYLPFHIDDTDKVNAAFEGWRREQLDEHKYIVDLWTYVFVRRYFLQKFARETNGQWSDLEALVAQAYRKAESKAHTVYDTARYASWVSKICKNTFINHFRSRHTLVPLPENDVLRGEVSQQNWGSELPVVHRAVRSAVNRLPDFLRDVARLRFIEQRSYEEIGDATGRPLPVVRAYVSKAMAQFRHDPHLLELRDSVLEP